MFTISSRYTIFKSDDTPTYSYLYIMYICYIDIVNAIDTYNIVVIFFAFICE